MKTFNIYTLGCKVNQYDSNCLKKKLISSGLEYKEKNSNVSIINTCSVTKSAISKNKQIIRKVRKENPEAIIILTGCWPKVYKEEAEEMEVNYVFSTGQEEDLIRMIINYEPSTRADDLSADNIQADKICRNNNFAGDKSRYFIKIQDGCEQYCAYCVVPYARGGLQSRPESEVINEISEAVENGFREIILSGVHIGLYGKDIEAQNSKLKTQSDNLKLKNNLTGLIKEIIKIKDLGRIRISSISVTEIGDEFMEIMASSNKLCRHLHISLQSGCDKILKSMNRPYDAEFFRLKVKKLREVIPDIAITTDVIVGFPGETEEDFKATYDFCREMEFSKIHVFSFSAHEKTPAAKMKNQVSGAEIKERSKRLNKLSRELETAYKKKFKGRELDVVVDNRMDEGELKGKTEFYFDVAFKMKENEDYNHDDLVGKIVKVKNWK